MTAADDGGHRLFAVYFMLFGLAHVYVIRLSLKPSGLVFFISFLEVSEDSRHSKHLLRNKLWAGCA